MTEVPTEKQIEITDSEATPDGSKQHRKNNTWYYFNPNSTTTVVFVHGFLSDANSCWLSKSGRYWPDLIKEDARFEAPSIFLGGYHTAADSGSYKIHDCAEELIRALERVDTAGTPAPISTGNLLFVCHSLGGVVTRYALDAHSRKFSNKAIGLALIASPSLGSKYADLFSGVISLFGNDTARQLKYLSSSLVDLDHRFKLLVDEKRIPNLVGAEAIEHRGIGRLPFVPHLLQPVVRYESASRYWPSQILPNTDHASIAKPEHLDSPPHLFLYDFFSRSFLPGACVIPQTELKIGSEGIRDQEALPSGGIDFGSPSRVLFDIYTRDCAPYYLERSIDGELCRTVPLYSIWLHGPSGAGKTSAIRHLVQNLGAAPLEVSLSACHGNLQTSRLLEEVALTAFQRFGIDDYTSPHFSTLVNLLAKHAQTSPLVLFIDEVPISAGDTVAMEEFVTFVGTLLDAVKRRCSSGNVRFAISSIAQPSLQGQGTFTKLAEQIRQAEMALWVRAELQDLLAFLLPRIGESALTDNEIDAVVKHSKGSPRYVKSYLRNRLITPGASAQEVLLETTDQIIS
ncbi:MAG: AAA family ATPase [Thiobacillus sp.]|nr:AAA family ATPase [Thiobacillus sp.]